MAQKSKSPPNNGRPPMATRDDLQAFLKGVARIKNRIKDGDEVARGQMLRQYLQRYDRDTLRGLLSRAYGDALKSPSQKLGTAKLPPDNRSSPAKPVGRRKKKRRAKIKRPARR